MIEMMIDSGLIAFAVFVGVFAAEEARSWLVRQRFALEEPPAEPVNFLLSISVRGYNLAGREVAHEWYNVEKTDDEFLAEMKSIHPQVETVRVYR